MSGGYPPNGYSPYGPWPGGAPHPPNASTGPVVPAPPQYSPLSESNIYNYPHQGAVPSGINNTMSTSTYNPNSIYTPYSSMIQSAQQQPSPMSPPGAHHPMVYSGVQATSPPPPMSYSSYGQYPSYGGYPPPAGGFYPVNPSSGSVYSGQPQPPQRSSSSPEIIPKPSDPSLLPQSSSSPHLPPQPQPPPQVQPQMQSQQAILATAQQNLVKQQKQGVLKVDMKGFYWVLDSQEPGSVIFVPQSSLNSAQDGDTVVVQLHNRSDGKQSGVVLKILQRAPAPSSPPAPTPQQSQVPSSAPAPASPSTLGTAFPQSQGDSASSAAIFLEGSLAVDQRGRGVVTTTATGETVVVAPMSIQTTGASPGDVVRVQIVPSATRTSDGLRLGHIISVSSPRTRRNSYPPSGQSSRISELQSQLTDVTKQLLQVQTQLSTAQPAELEQLSAQQQALTGMIASIQNELNQLKLSHLSISPREQSAPAPSPLPNPANQPQSPTIQPPPLVLPPGHVAVNQQVWSQSPYSVMTPSSSASSSKSPPPRTGPDFIWAPGMPHFMKLSESERSALKQQFQGIDKQNRGYIGEKELRESLGLVGFDEVLAKLFVRAFDRDNDSMISQDDFMNTMAVMLKGSASEKLDVACNMIDVLSTGRVTKEDLFRIINSMYRVLTNMRIPVYETDIHAYVNELWSLIDQENATSVTREIFKTRALKHQNRIVGLGLVEIPPDPPKLPKRGVSVSFGHFYWSLALQMMVGMRLAIDQQRNREDKAIRAADFTEVKQFEISSNDLTKKYVFTDFAPFVFKRIREMSGIDEKSYMSSLGPEQLLGNMIMGNLSSLSMNLSDGKSGSFFFTSHDGRFLVKTISAFEVSCLKKMLSNYYQHLATNSSTMIVRVYGFHSINQQTFIVMGNVFSTQLLIDELYDLKGSTVGRTGGNSAVKKDLDFTRTIRLSPEHRQLFIQQLHSDANFLRNNNVLDYSLLVGIRKMRDEDWVDDIHPPVLINGKVPFWAQVKGGMRGYNDYGQPDNEIFFVGIIDIFTEYGLIKQAENFVKSLVHGPDRISAIPPDRYAERFLKYIESLIR